MFVYNDFTVNRAGHKNFHRDRNRPLFSANVWRESDQEFPVAAAHCARVPAIIDRFPRMPRPPPRSIRSIRCDALARRGEPSPRAEMNCFVEKQVEHEARKEWQLVDQAPRSTRVAATVSAAGAAIRPACADAWSWLGIYRSR